MRSPSIGLTRGLWQDRERYLDSYWSRLPDLWLHGDFASRDADGSWYVHGRSDDTLKIAGKRTGPSEIEALLMSTGLLIDAADGLHTITSGEVSVRPACGPDTIPSPAL